MYTNTLDPFATPVWPLSASGDMQEAQKRGLKVAFATINGKMAGAHVDYSVNQMVSKEKAISTIFNALFQLRFGESGSSFRWPNQTSTCSRPIQWFSEENTVIIKSGLSIAPYLGTSK